MTTLAQVRHIQDGDVEYDAISVWCPGCASNGGHGLHWLPITDTQGKRPVWSWNGDLVNVFLEPSILTKMSQGEGRPEFVCHSYLRHGQWEFLADCTHALVGQTVPMQPLPDWAVS